MCFGCLVLWTALLVCAGVAGGGVRVTRPVKLRGGVVRGVARGTVDAYLGLPYAAPPVGPLRFMPPVSAPQWEGVLMATKSPPSCWQRWPEPQPRTPPPRARQQQLARLQRRMSPQSEDCLYLNVFVPRSENDGGSSDRGKAVVVWAVGESWWWGGGGGAAYDGGAMAARGDVIVVTANHRAGLWGWLAAGDTANAALLDVAAALHWVKDNIAALKGDPTRVTLAGHQHGAHLASLLMLSPLANGLFQRAILMGGGALCDGAVVGEPAVAALQVTHALRCDPSASSDVLLSCLQNKTVEEIQSVEVEGGAGDTLIGPTVGGIALPALPADTLRTFSNLLSDYSVLSGVVGWEGYHTWGALELQHGVLDGQRDSALTAVLAHVLYYLPSTDGALRYVLDMYAPSRLDPSRWSVEQNRDVILDALSDARTVAPVVRFADIHAAAAVGGRAFFYVFDHNSVSSDYAQLNKSVPGAELPYVFGAPLGPAGGGGALDSGVFSPADSFTPVERQLSETVIRMWSNFIKFGNPNGEPMSPRRRGEVEWPPYTAQRQDYLRIDLSPRVGSAYRGNFTQFWNVALPQKLRRQTAPTAHAAPPRAVARKPVESRRPVSPIAPSSSYGRERLQPALRPPTPDVYRQIAALKPPSRRHPPPLETRAAPTTTTTQSPTEPTPTSSTVTLPVVTSLAALFLAITAAILAVLYKKKRKRLHTNSGHHLEAGRSPKADRGALRALKDGCNVIKSISFDRTKPTSRKTRKDRPEPCKTPKSDDSGGFRERFQLRRHLSTSTLDAHTKVREWIASDVTRRDPAGIMRGSNRELNEEAIPKPHATKSEEILTKKSSSSDQRIKVSRDLNTASSKKSQDSNTKRTSEKTTSTSDVGSRLSIESIDRHGRSSRSGDSLKRKRDDTKSSCGNVDKSIIVSPSAATILIESSKSLDHIEKHSGPKMHLRQSKNEKDDAAVIHINEVTLSLSGDRALKISHKHSTSDPVQTSEPAGTDRVDGAAPPKVDINVTSRDEGVKIDPLSPAEALLTIQRRNYPKVLPDHPRMQKRLSLQASTLRTFRSFDGGSASRAPPPPPRVSTLDRRPRPPPPLSSFRVSNTRMSKSVDVAPKNYENIDELSDTATLPSQDICGNADPIIPALLRDRDLPKVIIASGDPSKGEERHILIKPASSVEIAPGAPRIRLPDDFHSRTNSLTSFSSFCSDEEILEDDDENEDDDELLQELVCGGGLDDALDSKGPDTFIKNLEIVAVRLNAPVIHTDSDNYVPVSDLHLPPAIEVERTARVTSGYSKKLRPRPQDIACPPEKAVRLPRKTSVTAGTILPKSLRRRKKSIETTISDQLQHSNSTSSNDTETSTGTVKKIEVK